LTALSPSTDNYIFDKNARFSLLSSPLLLVSSSLESDIFNALVESNETPKQVGECFDSISICLSKGLGAPVGSLLLGNQEFINKSRRIRKVFLRR
jgi:hypothetical protein